MADPHVNSSVLHRVPDDDPNRCQATGQLAQCPYRATGSRDPENPDVWVGSKYCARHGGNSFRDSEKAESTRLYLSALWQDRIGRQANHPKYKSLREEMGVLRMTLETRLNACHSEQDLLLYAGQITELVREVGKLGKVAHGIEKDMGHLLDKDQAEAWVQELLGIISQYIADPDSLQKLSEDMIASLEARTKPFS